MTEPTQRQVDSELKDSIDLFQRADVGKVTSLSPIVPKQILLVFDGSQQDRAVLSLGRQIREQTNADVTYTFVASSAEQQLSAETLADVHALPAKEVTATGDENYERILAETL